MARKSRKNIEPSQEAVYEQPVYNVGGYIRLSVEDNRNKGDSLDTQRSILQNYIAVTPELKLHDFYIDNGTTGTNFERPAFKKMLADAERGIINCIIVKDLSRFGRNAIDTGYYIEKYLPMLKVRFIAVTDGFDTFNANPGDGIMLPLKNMINEAYALDISKKIKAQQRQAMKSGEFIGARPPYGYLKSPDNCHKLVVDEIAAPVVRQIFEWAYEKVGVNSIVRRLNESGITTPSHYRRELGLISHENLVGNGAWQTMTVNRLLTDEVYVGDMVQGKSRSTCHKQTAVPENEWIRVQNTHEPIISREVFNAVQTYRKEVAKEAVKHRKAPYTENIFKGKIFCGHCGGALHRQRCQRRKTDDIYVFHCLSNSRKARGSCVPYMLPEEELTASVFDMIQKHADAVIGKSIKLRKNQTVVEAGRTAVKSELAAVRQEIDKDNRLLKSLYESLVTGIITSDEYRQMRSDYETRIEGRITLTGELERRQTELETQIAEYCALSDIIGKVGKKANTAELVEKLINRIQVFSDRHIEVGFSFESGFDRLDEVCCHE